MSDTNNNIPTRITQLEEATEYEDGMFFAVAKAGRGTYKIPVDEMTPNEQALSDKIENEIVPAVENSFAYGTVDESEIASFPDGSDLPMPKLEVAIEPVQEGSGDPSPTNIRPISGWSAVDVTRCGAFLISKDDFEQGTYGQHGEEASNIYRIRSNDFIPVIGGKELRLFYSPSTILFSVAIFDSNDTSTNTKELDTGWLNSGSKITIPNNGKYMRILAKKTDNVATMNPSDIENIRLFYEDTYSTITIQLGDTYYGGKLDVVSGVLTVDRAEIDLGSRTYIKAVDGYFYAYISDISIINFNANEPTAECEIYKLCTSAEWYGKTIDSGIFGVGSSHVIYIADTRFSDGDSLKTALVGKKLVYTLATPTTIQLTPTQVSSLMGVNNIWADCGKILKVEYIRDLDIVINSLLERIAALEG